MSDAPARDDAPDRPYHKYVFDETRRVFVGAFEEMYRREDLEGYDSWCQDDTTHLSKRVSLAILAGYRFARILDIGCGKGAFTHLLKTPDNYVLGIDVSPTAIAKARARYPEIDFRTLPASRVAALAAPRWDLVTALEVMSYLDHWRGTVREIASMTRYFYLTLYLPPRPIGFVKSFDELTAEVARHFSIDVHLTVNHEQLQLMARAAG